MAILFSLDSLRAAHHLFPLNLLLFLQGTLHISLFNFLFWSYKSVL